MTAAIQAAAAAAAAGQSTIIYNPAPNGGLFGYRDASVGAAFGSLQGLCYGAQVLQMLSDNGGTGVCTLILNGILSQGFFRSWRYNSPPSFVLLTSAAANSFVASAGRSTWTWNSTTNTGGSNVPIAFYR